LAAVMQPPRAGLGVQAEEPPELLLLLLPVRQVLLVESQTSGEQQVAAAEQLSPAAPHCAVQEPPVQVRPVQHSDVTVQTEAAAPQVEEPLLELLELLPPSAVGLLEQADKRPPATNAAASAPRTFFELTFIGGTPGWHRRPVCKFGG
jgi:hypothetical protein